MRTNPLMEFAMLREATTALEDERALRLEGIDPGSREVHLALAIETMERTVVFEKEVRERYPELYSSLGEPLGLLLRYLTDYVHEDAPLHLHK